MGFTMVLNMVPSMVLNMVLNIGFILIIYFFMN
jgi:hypothetical protein